MKKKPASAPPIPVPEPPQPPATIQEVKRLISKEPQGKGENVYKTGYYFIRYYLPVLLISLGYGLGMAWIYVQPMDNIIGNIAKVLAPIVSIPIVAGLVCILLVRAFLDRNRIIGSIKRALPISYIRANFFMQDKKIKRVVYGIDPNGITFRDGKQTYIIDYKKIWFDDDGVANSWYFPNIPVPIEFEFHEPLTNFSRIFSPDFDKLTPEEQNEKFVNVVGTMYSSENLTKLQEDKFFAEFQKPPEKPEHFKMLTYMMIAMVIIVVVMALLLVFIATRDPKPAATVATGGAV